jgi:pyruvate,water dikinase
MGVNGANSYTLAFAEAREADFPRIGGKCASLARMIAGGQRVPAGFAVTTDAYSLHLQSGGLRASVERLLSRIEVDNVDDEETVSREIRAAITAHAMPPRVEQAIREAYREMSPDGQLPVAVRSSATAEDLPDASFAGQQDTYLWVVGEDAVVNKVKACWASLFNARAISYRAKNHLGNIDVLMAVGVQKMVNASAAGVAMTLNPINGDRTKIVIDAAFGLGEPVVSGEITPDNFVVEKVLMQILGRRISEKDFELVADPGARRTVERVIPPERRTMPSLTDAQVLAVANLAKSLERSSGCPQDVEWAIDADLPEGNNLVALQSRPETVWSQRKSAEANKSYETGIAGVLGTLLAPVHDKAATR